MINHLSACVVSAALLVSSQAAVTINLSGNPTTGAQFTVGGSVIPDGSTVRLGTFATEPAAGATFAELALSFMEFGQIAAGSGTNNAAGANTGRIQRSNIAGGNDEASPQPDSFFAGKPVYLWVYRGAASESVPQGVFGSATIFKDQATAVSVSMGSFASAFGSWGTGAGAASVTPGATAGTASGYQLAGPGPGDTTPSVDSLITNQLNPVLSGQAILGVGGTLSVAVNGATYQPTPDAGGLWTVNTATDAVASGSLGLFVHGQNYAVTATSRDALGNTAWGRAFVLIDTEPPAAPSVDGLPTNQLKPVLTGMALLRAGETISVAVNGATYQPSPAADGFWTVNTATAAVASGSLGIFVNGQSYGVIATSCDATGNSSQGSASVLIDTTSPPVPSVNAIVSNQLNPVLTGQAVLNAGETCSLFVNGATYQLAPATDGLWTIDTATAAVASGSLGGFVNGQSYLATATSRDAAGNSSQGSASVLIDATPPPTPVVNAIASNQLKPVLTGEAVLGAGETCSLFVNGETYQLTPTAGGLWTVNMADAAVGSGSLGNFVNGQSYVVTATSRDAAGNTSQGSASVLISTGPSVTLHLSGSPTSGPQFFVGGELIPDGSTVRVGTFASTPPAGATFADLAATFQEFGKIPLGSGTDNVAGANSGRIQRSNIAGGTDAVFPQPDSYFVDKPVYIWVYSGAASEATPQGVFGSATTFKNQATPVYVYMSSFASAFGSFSVGPGSTTSSYTPGPIPGTASSYHLGGLLTIDTTPPAAPSVDALVTHQLKPVLTGKAILLAGETISVAVNGATYQPTLAAGGLWTVNTASATVISGSLGVFGNGQSYAVTATSRDAAGNTAQGRAMVLIDTTPPATPSVDLLVTNQLRPVLTGKAVLGAGETCRVVVNGATYEPVPGAGGLWTVNTATAAASSGRLGIFVNGQSYGVTATSCDAAGNTSQASASARIDTTPPAAPSVDALVSNQLRPVLSGLAKLGAGETLRVAVNGAVYAPTPNPGGFWTVDTAEAAVASGSLAVFVNGQSYVVKATSRDAAGNTSQGRASVLIDTTPPAAPSVDELVTNQLKPVLTGQAILKAGEKLRVDVHGATYALTPSAGGLWTLDTATAAVASGSLGVLVNGQSYAVTATSRDAAGNRSAGSAFVGIDAREPTAPTVVSNLSAVPRVGTKLVDLTYDLSAASPASTISLQVSSDGGITFAVPAVAVTGAVGPGVSTGTGKKLTWNAGVDWNAQFSSQVRFKVVADDAPAGFVSIPAGTFSMGDAKDSETNALVHEVNVSACYLGKTEVTKAEWDEVRAWATAHGYTDLSVGAGVAANHPVQTVSWWDAIKWCNARSERDGLTPCYVVGGSPLRTGTTVPALNWSAKGHRLPTEAEWEKGARGGLSGKRFPWGDTISHSQANYYSHSSSAYDVSPTRGYHPSYAAGNTPHTSPVGSFAANGYGLQDMAGNLSEWCWDGYGAYAPGVPLDPKGARASGGRVLRGGSWEPYGDICRSAYRNYHSPGFQGNILGFRVARRSAPSISATTSDQVIDTKDPLAWVLFNAAEAALPVTDLGLLSLSPLEKLSTVSGGKAHDGTSALKFSSVDGAASYAERSIAGPALVSFWWRASSEKDYDLFSYSIDGVVQESISGDGVWLRRSLTLGAGRHAVRWTYRKDDADKNFEDAGYLDELVILNAYRDLEVSRGGSILEGGATVDYGAVKLDDPEVAKAITFKNVGTILMPITASLLTDGGFVFANGQMALTQNLAPGQEASFSLMLQTGVAGRKNALLQITAAGSRTDPPAITLSGLIQAPILQVAGSGMVRRSFLNKGTAAAWEMATTGLPGGASGAALKTGSTPDNGNSTIGARFDGPGLLRWQWKVSAQKDFDWLACEVNGVEVAGLSAKAAVWQSQVIQVPAEAEVRWIYRKDAANQSGTDSGYLVDVRFDKFSGVPVSFNDWSAAQGGIAPLEVTGPGKIQGVFAWLGGFDPAAGPGEGQYQPIVSDGFYRYRYAISKTAGGQVQPQASSDLATWNSRGLSQTVLSENDETAILELAVPVAGKVYTRLKADLPSYTPVIKVADGALPAGSWAGVP